MLVIVLVFVLVLVRHSTFPIDYYDGGTVHGVLLIITRGSTPRTRCLVLLTLVLGTHVYKVKVSRSRSRSRSRLGSRSRGEGYREGVGVIAGLRAGFGAGPRRELVLIIA